MIKDSRDMRLACAKSQLWASAATQEAVLRTKLISMIVEDTIRPQQQLMKQCQTEGVVQQIWAQSKQVSPGRILDKRM